MKDTPISSFAEGEVVKLSSGKEVRIIRHGDSGTVIQPTARIAKQVTDKRTGKTSRFSSQAAPYTISSGAPVTKA